MTSHYARSIRQSCALHDAALCYGEPLTLDQAAQALGVKAGSVKDALRKLRIQGYQDLPEVAINERPYVPHRHTVQSPIPLHHPAPLATPNDRYPAGFLVLLPPRRLDDGRLAWLVR